VEVGDGAEHLDDLLEATEIGDTDTIVNEVLAIVEPDLLSTERRRHVGDVVESTRIQVEEERLDWLANERLAQLANAEQVILLLAEHGEVGNGRTLELLLAVRAREHVRRWHIDALGVVEEAWHLHGQAGAHQCQE